MDEMSIGEVSRRVDRLEKAVVDITDDVSGLRERLARLEVILLIAGPVLTALLTRFLGGIH